MDENQKGGDVLYLKPISSRAGLDWSKQNRKQSRRGPRDGSLKWEAMSLLNRVEATKGMWHVKAAKHCNLSQVHRYDETAT